MAESSGSRKGWLVVGCDSDNMKECKSLPITCETAGRIIAEGPVMGRGRPGIIQRYGDEVIKDLEKTTLPLAILGEKYGVTKQALSQFVKKEGIRREPAPRKKGHAVDQCSICGSILRISKIPHSEFLTGRTIRERLRPSVRYERYRRHIRILKEEGLMHQKFGGLASKKSEKAYAMYFTFEK